MSGVTSLSDMMRHCLDDISHLSVKQMKQILSANNVSFKGFLEKEDFTHRLTLFYTQTLSQTTGEINLPI